MPPAVAMEGIGETSREGSVSTAYDTVQVVDVGQLHSR